MTVISETPAFCQGIQYWREDYPELERHGQTPAIGPNQQAIADPSDPGAAYQTLLAADALRYLTLQVTASKASGHPGGFASIAEGIAALVMLGHKNIITEVGHHAPGFYSTTFLDRSLEAMGIETVAQLRERFREYRGLLGHLSGYIPGLLNPAGPLGQGQHFAMAAARLHPGTLFPVTIGDGGMGEPYVMSAFGHFATAYPQVTNFLPVLVWNGYSQEHHSMVATQANQAMVAYWQHYGFERVELVDALAYDDAGQPGPYADSTQFSLAQRLAFTSELLQAMDRAARSALGGERTALIVKQLKGAGVHERGARAHNLHKHHTLEEATIVSALQQRALPARAWALVRTNFERAGGGPAARQAVTETEGPLPELGELPLQEYPIGGEPQVATTALGELAAHVGQQDPEFIAANADGNAASGLGNLNKALQIRHPTADPTYDQHPEGQIYEPLSEDACAGLTASTALLGGRALWCSYESFAINGLPIWQTVTQALAELRRPAPSAVALFTAGALEQGRNGWTHQRPEVENYLAALMRNGNVFALFPPDANASQACYQWALQAPNKGIAIVASKSPVPVRLTLAQARQALEQGAITLQQTPGERTVVLAVVGDLALQPAFEAAERLQGQGIGSRIVSVVNPRRLYRPGDVAWQDCAQPDGQFLDGEGFQGLFGGDALIGLTGAASGMLEPLLLRSQLPRDVLAWQRGETAASPGELMALNGLTPERIATRAAELLA